MQKNNTTQIQIQNANYIMVTNKLYGADEGIEFTRHITGLDHFGDDR